MSSLVTCDECDGFVPGASNACPHCGHRNVGSAAGAPRLVKGAAKVAAVAATMMTLMACYGGGMHMMEPNYPACTPQDKDMDGTYTCQNPSELTRDGMAIDCNDADPTTLPGAVDPIGDNLDQDCDGADGTPSTREPVPGAALQQVPASAPAGGFASPP